jgi:hypothetical protein
LQAITIAAQVISAFFALCAINRAIKQIRQNARFQTNSDAREVMSNVAKDGTTRGGARAGAGRKPKALAEKILEGNPGKRPIKVVEFYGVPASGELSPPDFLKIASKETAENYPTADRIYTQVAAWLAGTGCANLVSPTLVEDFAINRRAFFECEYMNKRLGRITGGKRSPYVDMAVQYAGLMRVAWDRIWNIVAQNTEKRFEGGGVADDAMERLLSGGKV